MKTIIPGSVSPEYLEEYRKTQIDFFRSITASAETTALAKEAWPIDNWGRPFQTRTQPETEKEVTELYYHPAEDTETEG